MTVLKTSRLHLQPVSSRDRDIVLAVRSEPEVLRWLPVPQGHSLDRYVELRLTEMEEHWRDRGYGVWLVCNRTSRRAIGYCGLRFLPEFDAVELLYALHPKVWGWGLATEASRAILDWAWRRTDFPGAIALTLPENLASRGVMENVGMHYEKTVEFHGYTCAYYAMANPLDALESPLSRPIPHLLKVADIAAMPEHSSVHPLNSNAVRHRRSLGDALKLERLGLHWVRVEPGRDTTQFHFHHHEEEFVYILSGRGLAEIGDRQVEVEPGDLLAFTAPSAPHAMSNPFAEDLIYLMGGERLAFDLCDYPRLRKRLIRTQGDRVAIGWDDFQPFGSYPLRRPDED